MSRKKKKIMKMKTIFLLAVFCLFSCGEDFVYHNNELVARQIVETVNVKDIKSHNDINILFVIDNSGSMGQEQADVRTNINDFIQNFSGRTGIYWKIGLVSTDVKDSPYLGFSNPFDLNNANPVQTLQRTVARLGISGSGTEKVFDSVINALSNYNTFFTQDAFFAVIAVTDAEDQSLISPDDFVLKVQQIRRGPGLFKYYGVLGAGSFGCQHDLFPTYIGGRHEKVITLTKGQVYSLCSRDFGKLLAKIGDNIVKEALYPRISLDVRPETSTIVVTHKGRVLIPGPESQGGEWYYDYDTNSIAFYSLDFATGVREDVNIAYKEKLIYEKRP